MSPPRLWVLTAAAAPAAVILRRGPSAAMATLGWDRDRHQLTPGQPLAGRIAPFRSDLSPDGRHLVVFAGTGHARAQAAGVGRAAWWTAVSRAPWLSAILVVPMADAWCGGGAFTADGRLWLNGVAAAAGEWPAELGPPAGPGAFPASTDGFHLGALHAATQRLRGWIHAGGERYAAVLTRPLEGGWLLERRFVLAAPGRALVAAAHALVEPAGGRRLDRPGWEWADRHGPCLQFAAGGALHEAPLDAVAGIGPARQVADVAAVAVPPRPAPGGAGHGAVR
ncbi:MAG: hypothetical protein KJZ85_14125 [Rhodobacteraceae bacterium]|nr:hypothetical protein [Paracoccaceae bacterium]